MLAQQATDVGCGGHRSEAIDRDDYPYPVLPNCDGGPSKDAYLARGWDTRRVSREALHDLFFNPGEGRNLIDHPEYAGILADLRARLLRWMEETGDPLLAGPVLAPPGARINAQDQRSAADPQTVVGSPAGTI